MTREEAWEELKETITELRDNDGTCTQQQTCKFLCNLMGVLEKQITDGWIPVSERLPKIDAENGWKASDTVLICLADGMMHMGFYCEDKKWRFCESGEAKEPFWKDVKAWMPLPKSYKEADE